jgi:hypothetical protein
MKSFRKKVSKNRVYREYVDILNGKLQLSLREADVLAVLLQLNAEWGSMVKEVGNILSTDVRRVLMRETLITKTNLARYITQLVDKGILVPSEDGKLLLNEIFIPEFVTDEKTKEVTCEVKFVLEVV